MRTSASMMHRRRGAPVSDVTLEAPKLLLKCAESDGGKTNEERMPQPGRRGTAGAGRHGHGGDPEDGTRNGAQTGRSHHAADRDPTHPARERKSGVEGKRVCVTVEHGVGPKLKKKHTTN